MICTTAIREAVLASSPFTWAFIDDLFEVEDARALSRAYPRDHFKVVAGYDGEKGYTYHARQLISMGASGLSHADDLDESWRRLGQGLLSHSYREAISKLIGRDVTRLAVEANVFHYGPGAWLGPHVDLVDKAVTHVLYFNETWSPDDGGQLAVLRSKDMLDVERDVQPVVGNSVVLVRSDASWHAVRPVAEGCASSRKSVTVTFYEPGSRSTMWPDGDTTPLSWYDCAA